MIEILIILLLIAPLSLILNIVIKIASILKEVRKDD